MRRINALRRGGWPATCRAAVLFGAVLWSAAAAPAQPGAPAPVATAAIIEREVAAGQTFVGTVEPVHKSLVGSTEEGRVVELLVDEGDEVVADQPLVRLRTVALEIALAAAKAEQELRRQELAELQNGTRPEEIEQARAKMRSARALWDYAKARLERNRQLFEESRTITREQYDEALSAAVAAEQAYEAARAAYDLAEKGPREEQILQAEARLLMQEETVRRIEDQIAERTIRAPFDGTITARHTELGQWVAVGGPVVEMVALDPLEVRVFVPEQFVTALREGMTVQLAFDAVPRELIEGRLLRVIPQADLRSRTFPVRVLVKNPKSADGYRIKPGMLARATLAAGRAEMALLVPKDALVLGGASPTVFLFEPDRQNPQEGAVRPVPVQVGVAYESWIQVIAPLRAGQQVVTRGNERLHPGARVRLLP